MARPAKAATNGDIKETKAATVDDGLIAMAHPMHNDIRVHPDQLQSWKNIGWQVVE